MGEIMIVYNIRTHEMHSYKVGVVFQIIGRFPFAPVLLLRQFTFRVNLRL